MLKSCQSHRYIYYMSSRRYFLTPPWNFFQGGFFDLQGRTFRPKTQKTCFFDPVLELFWIFPTDLIRKPKKGGPKTITFWIPRWPNVWNPFFCLTSAVTKRTNSSFFVKSSHRFWPWGSKVRPGGGQKSDHFDHFLDLFPTFWGRTPKVYKSCKKVGSEEPPGWQLSVVVNYFGRLGFKTLHARAPAPALYSCLIF